MGSGFKKISRGFMTEEEKKNRPKVTLELLKRIWSYLVPYWKQMLLVFVFIVISSILGLLPSVLTGKIIDDGLLKGNLKTLVILVSFSIGVTLVADLIRVAES